MMTREETMKVIADGVRGEDICPVIDEIAKKTVYCFELASECAFENDEDEILFDLMMRLYADDKCMEAVDMLMMAFSLVGMEEAIAIVGIVAVTGRDDVYRMFLQRFIAHSDRCRVQSIKVTVKEHMN